jgi:hypothetical protein
VKTVNVVASRKRVSNPVALRPLLGFIKTGLWSSLLIELGVPERRA